MIELDNIIENYIETEDFVEKKYLEYAIATLSERAIPYLHDGLKPVHRRILYAMKELGNLSTVKHKKSARVVGDVIGKYHPHGDSSVYDAMVRLSQPWNLRYPLVDGQGNFGSRDGDSAAAMRYTESRLTKFAEEVLLSEIKLGTVDFRPNYDNIQEEPVILPAKLNVALLNGASGIAVGMATEIPSHNIREITDATLALIKNPDMSHEEIMEIVKGPDFPEGGQIIDSQESINNVYKEGNGTVRVRAKWKVEKLSRGQWQVVVEELPPNMNTKKILEKIDRITNPQVTKDKNGKAKPLSKKILSDKIFMSSLLSKAVDESDKKTPVRLVLEPKNSRQSPEDFMNSLIGRIDLEQNIKVNLTIVGLDNLPKVKSIKEILSEWIDFRFQVLTRRTNFSLEKVKSRIHILEGRLIALLNIDEVVNIIKNSDQPKLDLINKFNITEIQAEDILDIKLRQLARLENEKLQQELDSLIKEMKRLEALLSSKVKMNNLMAKEIEDTTQLFEDNRRTEIKPDKMIIAKSLDSIIDEPVTVIITDNNWLTLRKGHEFDLSNIQLKLGDNIKKVIECRSIDNLASIASNGRGFSIKVSDVPSGKGSFVHLNTLINIPSNVHLIDLTIVSNNDLYLFANDEGYGFISKIDNLLSKNKAGKNFMTITSDKTQIFNPLKIEEDNLRINVLSTDLRLLSYNINEIKELDKGKGIQLIKLADKNKIKEITLSSNDYIEYFENGKKKIMKDSELMDYHSKRALRGKIVKDSFRLK